MKYSSNAKWTKIEDSKDIHDSINQADSICTMLEERWGEGMEPCPIRGNVVETWVEEEVDLSELNEELKSKNNIIHPLGDMDEYKEMSYSKFFVTINQFEASELRDILVEQFFGTIKDDCGGDFKLCFSGNYGESLFDKDLANQILLSFIDSSMPDSEKYQKAIKTAILGSIGAQDKESFIENILVYITDTMIFKKFFQNSINHEESMKRLIKYIKDNKLV